MTFDTLRLQIDDGIARITLGRQDNANAMNPILARELLDAAIACDVDPSVRAVLIDAEGRMFCAGGDLDTFRRAGDDLARLLRHMTVDLHGAIARLARMRAPVIAAVQGAAAGAGFSLTTACDFVVAAQSAKFTMAYTRAGLVPDGSSTFFLPRLLGRRRALELLGRQGRNRVGCGLSRGGRLDRRIPQGRGETRNLREILFGQIIAV